MVIYFISPKDSDEICTMHRKSNNTKILMRIKTDKIIEKKFKSLLQKYQEGLEKKWEEVNLLLIVLICCVITFIK